MEAAQGMDHGFNGLRENLGAARDKDPPAIEVGEAKITANVRRSQFKKVVVPPRFVLEMTTTRRLARRSKSSYDQ